MPSDSNQRSADPVGRTAAAHGPTRRSLGQSPTCTGAPRSGGQQVLPDRLSEGHPAIALGDAIRVPRRRIGKWSRDGGCGRCLAVARDGQSSEAVGACRRGPNSREVAIRSQSWNPILRTLGMLSIVLLLSLGGCGLTSNQKTTLTSFGKSASSYGETLGSIAPSAMDAIDQMRVDNLSYATPTSRKEFDQVADRIPDYVHNPRARAHVALIVGLASALNEYGKALVDLANYGDSDERNKTFADIADKVDQAFGNPIGQAYATASGHAASLIASQVTDAIKRRDIAQVVRTYDVAIKAAGDLLIAEFKGEQEGTLFFAYNAALFAFQARIPLPEHHAKAIDAEAKVWDSAAALSEAEGRRQIVAAQKEYTLEKTAFESLKKEGIAATTALVKAHNELVSAMDKKTPSFGAVADFAKAAASLYTEFKSAK